MIYSFYYIIFLISKYWFINFDMSFVNYDGHCMLYGYGIYFIESIFYSIFMDFEFLFKNFHSGDVHGCSSLAIMTINGFTFPPLLIRLSING